MINLDYLWDIVLVAATGGVAVLYRKYFAPYMFRRGAWRFFKFSQGSRVVMIIPTISNPEFSDVEMIDETTPLESVYVTGHLNNYISQLLGRKGQIDIDLSIMCDPNILEENLIVIGGPNHNQCTDQLLRSFHNPLNFMGNTLVSTISGKKYEAVIQDSKIIEDYTIVVSRANPWNKNKHLVLLAACRGYGAIAAAEFLCNGGIDEIMSASHEKYSSTVDFFVVLSNKVNHFDNGHFKVISTKIEEVNFEKA